MTIAHTLAPAAVLLAQGESSGGGLTWPEIIDKGGNSVYILLAYLVVAGTYYSILLFRRVRQKQFSSLDSSQEYLGTVRELMRTEKYEEGVQLSQSPQLSRKALPQLVALALRNRKDALPRIKRDLVVKFESDIIASLEHLLSYIYTFTRMGPLAGLLGTVVSMIAAFAKLGSAKGPEAKVNPADLAESISLALWATAIGLLVATPLTLVGNMLNVRIRRLEDDTQEALAKFMEDFERSPVIARRKQGG